jgi:hypothetical protein
MVGIRGVARLADLENQGELVVVEELRRDRQSCARVVEFFGNLAEIGLHGAIHPG